MGNVVGIDLGTTNSVAALKWVNVEIVTNNEENTQPGGGLTRSVVGFSDGKLIVGDKALNHNSENVIISIKRLMGRGFNDPIVQQHLSRFGYKITQSTQGTDNSLSVWLDGREYQPEDISAEILKKVAQNAQLYQEIAGQKGKITRLKLTGV
jgi:molecular chaperone DnaK